MLVDTLTGLRGRRLIDEDGNPEVLELLPPATPLELASLEKEVPCAVPPEVRDALSVSTGLAHGPLESWSLLGLGGGFGLEDLFPAAHSIAHDGYGNYWILDLRPETRVWAPVYYACHDPPVIVYQAASIEEFLLQTVQLWEKGARSPVDIVHEDASSTIWKHNPGVLSQAEAARSPAAYQAPEARA